MDKLIRKHFENFNVTFGKEDDYLGEMVNDDYITIKNAIIDICKEYHTQQLTIQRVVHSKITVLVTYWKWQESGHVMLDDTKNKTTKIVEVDKLTDINGMFTNLIDIKILK